MKMTLEQLIDLGERHARKMLLKRHEPGLQPFYHLVAPEGQENAIVPCEWKDDQTKDMMVAVVKATAAIIKAEAALHVSEAWMLHLPKAPTSWHAKRQLANLPRPSESPERIEVVMLMATDGTTVKSRTLQMLRDRPGGRIISLVPLPENENCQFTGRMVDGIIPVRKEERT